MRVIGIVVVLAAAAASGYWSWRRATAILYYRSPNPTIRPSHLRPEAYERLVLARRKRQRLTRSALSAAIAAAVAALLVVMVDSGLSRR